MFNSKSNGNGSSPPPPPRNTGTVETLIGRQTEVTGDVRFTGGLHLDGRVLGNVASTVDKSAHLSISESGSVEGEIRVPMIVLNGAVVGDVYATEKVTLGAKARVTGNVFYKLIEMQSGAQVNGQLVHESMAAAMRPVPVAVQDHSQDYSHDSRIIDVQEVQPHGDGSPG
jgi:cytoskeletal protein CcmA (bactofilin family)